MLNRCCCPSRLFFFLYASTSCRVVSLTAIGRSFPVLISVIQFGNSAGRFRTSDTRNPVSFMIRTIKASRNDRIASTSSCSASVIALALIFFTSLLINLEGKWFFQFIGRGDYILRVAYPVVCFAEIVLCAIYLLVFI